MPTFTPLAVREEMRTRAARIAKRAAAAQGRESIAAALGVTGNAVRAWEKGPSRPSFALAEKILREYGATYGAKP